MSSYWLTVRTGIDAIEDEEEYVSSYRLTVRTGNDAVRDEEEYERRTW